MSQSTKVVARLPPNEPLLNAQGLPAMSWLYFFQALGRSTDQVVAADLSALVDQMVLDLVPLRALPPSVDVLPELSMPRVGVDVLPELAVPSLPAVELLPELTSTAALSRLVQRMTDLELWSL